MLASYLHYYLQINFLKEIYYYILGSLRPAFNRRKKVSKKKLAKSTLSKNIYNTKKSKKLTDKKIDIEELPFTTIRVTMHALRWIFFLIFIYIAVSIVLLLVQGGTASLTNIVVYSVTGFFTFFMGYFGWMFARSVMKMVSGKELHQDDF
jgi:uncharacterized membrane protein